MINSGGSRNERGDPIEACSTDGGNSSSNETADREWVFLAHKDSRLAVDLSREPYIICRELEDNMQIAVKPGFTEAIQRSRKFGVKLFKKSLLRFACRTVASPATLLHVSNGKVTVPSNFDAAADGNVHYLIAIYTSLGIQMETSDAQASIPEFSKGWDTNISYIFEQLLRITELLRDRDSVPDSFAAKARNPFYNRILALITYKWACKKGLVSYLTPEVKKLGNMSEVEFLDLVGGFGTLIKGNFGSRIASSIYQLTGILSSHPDICKQISVKSFLTGVMLRNSALPPKMVLEKRGNKPVPVQRGEINVGKLDSIRFLTPDERRALRNYNESGELEKKVRDFDNTQLLDRNYPEFVSFLKEKIGIISNRYFNLRRLSRTRLYAIKEIRRLSKLGDNIADSEFGRDTFISETEQLLCGVDVNLDKKGILMDRLKVDIVTSVLFPRKEEESE